MALCAQKPTNQPTKHNSVQRLYRASPWGKSHLEFSVLSPSSSHYHIGNLDELKQFEDEGPGFAPQIPYLTPSVARITC